MLLFWHGRNVEKKFVMVDFSYQTNQKIVMESNYSLSKEEFILGLFPINREIVRAIEINEEAYVCICGLLKSTRKAGYRYSCIGTNVEALDSKNKLAYPCLQGLHMVLLSDHSNNHPLS